MNRDVVMLAIKDLKEIISIIESKAVIKKSDNVKLEKELNSFLSNFSSYKIRNIKGHSQFLSGFQYAFNLMKHNKKVVTVKRLKKGGVCFPISFPLVIPCNEIYWIDAKNIVYKEKFENQYDNYLKKFSTKRIIETLDKLEKVI